MERRKMVNTKIRYCHERVKNKYGSIAPNSDVMMPITGLSLRVIRQYSRRPAKARNEVRSKNRKALPLRIRRIRSGSRMPAETKRLMGLTLRRL
jgi:hypothetical protein